MSQIETDVLIVGYGPVGAYGALLLAEAGLRVVIVERTAEIMPLPRAVGLDGESVRSFQRIGLGERVNAILQPPRDPDSVFFTDSRRRVLFGQDIPPLGPSGWREIAMFDQPELEALLREEVEKRRESIDVRLCHEATAIAQDADSVSLRARDLESGEELRVRARYAIGCDGASSFVRASLGIPWNSLGYDQDWLVIDIVQKPDAKLPLSTLQVCDPARLTTYVCTKDPYRRWEFQLLPGETREEMESEERIRALLDPWLPPEHYELRRKAVYQFHAANAERWREGRILLAGDAAHQTPPFLGQGLNAGFRDVVNLSWKLPMVLDGTSGDALLDTYFAERDAHAEDLVEWAVAIGQLMEALAAKEAGREPEGPSEHHRRSGYGQGRTAPPLRNGVVLAEQVEADLAGRQLAQPTLRGPDGAESRLDDLLGRGFGVVGRDAAALSLTPESRALLARIGATTLALDDFAHVGGIADRLLERHPAAIVRPDRYLFGAVDDAWSLDALTGELGRRLALRP